MSEDNKISNQKSRKGLSLIWPDRNQSFSERLISSFKKGFSYVTYRVLSLIKAKQQTSLEPKQRKTKEAKKIQKKIQQNKNNNVSIVRQSNSNAINSENYQIQEQDLCYQSKFNPNLIDPNHVPMSYPIPPDAQIFYKAFKNTHIEHKKQKIQKNKRNRLQKKQTLIYKKIVQTEQIIDKQRHRIDVQQERKPCFNLIKLLSRMDQQHNNRLAFIAKTKQLKKKEEEQKLALIKQQQRIKIQKQISYQTNVQKNNQITKKQINGLIDISLLNANRSIKQQQKIDQQYTNNNFLNNSQIIQQQQLKKKKQKEEIQAKSGYNISNENMKETFFDISFKQTYSKQFKFQNAQQCERDFKRQIILGQQKQQEKNKIGSKQNQESNNKIGSCQQSQKFKTPQKENPFVIDKSPLNLQQVINFKSPTDKNKSFSVGSSATPINFSSTLADIRANQQFSNPFSGSINLQQNLRNQRGPSLFQAHSALSSFNGPSVFNTTATIIPPSESSVSNSNLFSNLNQNGGANTNMFSTFFPNSASQQHNFFMSKPAQKNLFQTDNAPKIKHSINRRSKKQQRIQ